MSPTTRTTIGFNGRTSAAQISSCGDGADGSRRRRRETTGTTESPASFRSPVPIPVLPPLFFCLFCTNSGGEQLIRRTPQKSRPTGMLTTPPRRLERPASCVRTYACREAERSPCNNAGGRAVRPAAVLASVRPVLARRRPSPKRSTNVRAICRRTFGLSVGSPRV
jgi:hypothetical protein